MEEARKGKNKELINNVQRWFKDRDNLILFLIMLAAIIIRIYYFRLTLGQPLWWDEGEYAGMARAIGFGLDYDYIIVRPIFFPFIMGILFKVAYTEFLPRLMMLIMSVVAVYGMYLLGKEIYNKKVGLLAAFLFSLSYLPMFYTFRLLV